MKNIEFRKILFKGAFSVMACDGEVAESEVAEMKEMLGNSPYFDGLDHETELKLAFADLKKLSDEKLIVHFPRHIDILLDLGKYSVKPLQSNLEAIDLNAFDNLNLTN